MALPVTTGTSASGATSRPESRWRGRLLVYGLPVLLLLFGLNHAEYHFRRQRLQAAGGPVVAVRQEGGVLAGHNTIGIAEAGVGGGDFLRFATLAEWEFDAKTPSPCPPDVQAWSGRDVACIGFMYPLEPGASIKTFCLLRTTQTCCYGPRPQYNQYVLVEMKSAVKFERLRPVLVRGRFVADPQPGQGFIYRLEGRSCTRAGDDEPEVDPAESARKAGLPLFDFAWLAAAQSAGGKTVPADLAAVDGKRVVVSGYFLDRTEGPTPRILIGRDWWDGVSKGVRPTLASALPAYARDTSQVPPLWKDRGVMTGVLRIECDPQRWSEQGVASLCDAVRGVPGVLGARVRLDGGPFLELWHEALLLAAFVCFVLRPRRRATASSNAP